MERDLLDAKIFSGADESDTELTPRMKLQLKKMREGAVSVSVHGHFVKSEEVFHGQKQKEGVYSAVSNRFEGFCEKIDDHMALGNVRNT